MAVGAPISTGLMSLDGLFGLKGWQLMYIAEGLPTIILGVLCYFVMTNKPEQATFLTREEKDCTRGPCGGGLNSAPLLVIGQVGG